MNLEFNAEHIYADIIMFQSQTNLMRMDGKIFGNFRGIELLKNADTTAHLEEPRAPL